LRRSKTKWRVVLVEDDELNLELLQTVLEAAGIAALPATDARTGIELARREQPDAILMDVQMPGMDGLQATRALRAEPATSRIPVIAVTAHVKPEDRARCLEAGCILYLPKPVDTRALPVQVEGVIRAAAERGGAADRGAAAEPRAAADRGAADDRGGPVWSVRAHPPTAPAAPAADPPQAGHEFPDRTTTEGQE